MKSSSYAKCRPWLLLIGCAGVAGAQDQMPAEVKALPAWAGEEAAAAIRPPQYVFRDANGQIVGSYPNPYSPGRMITFRFWLGNRVDPHISASVTRATDGFTYKYNLRNGSVAATAIISWSVVGPVNENMTISHPQWVGVRGTIAAAPQALLPSVAVGTHHSWGLGTNQAIQPGAEIRDFTISSTFAPGLTTAYALGEGAIIVEPGPGEIPEEVVQQLIPL